MFWILREDPGPGKAWIRGRLTRIQQDSKRPGDMWVEQWQGISKKQKQIEIERWEKENRLQQAERARLGRGTTIPDEELEEYTSVMAQAKIDYPPPVPAAPAMSCKRLGPNIRQRRFTLPAITPDNYDEFCAEEATPSSSSTSLPSREHQDKLQPINWNTDPEESEFYAMVHKPIIHWQGIEDAAAAVDKEWNKLEKGHLPPKQQSEQGAWDLSRVRPKLDVKNEAKA